MQNTLSLRSQEHFTSGDQLSSSGPRCQTFKPVVSQRMMTEYRITSTLTLGKSTAADHVPEAFAVVLYSGQARLGKCTKLPPRPSRSARPARYLKKKGLSTMLFRVSVLPKIAFYTVRSCGQCASPAFSTRSRPVRIPARTYRITSFFIARDQLDRSKDR